MPDRMIRESITTSRSLAACSLFTELLFPRLLVLADNHGRFDAEPRVVCNRLFPLRDDVTSAQVAESLDELEAQGMIRRWMARGIRVGEFVAFDRHQTQAARFRKKPSVLPDPDEVRGDSRSVPVRPSEAPSASEILPIEGRGDGEGEESERREADASSHAPSLVPSDPLYAAMERLTAGRFRRKDPGLIKQTLARGTAVATLLAAFQDPNALEKGSVPYAITIAENWHANGGPPKRNGNGKHSGNGNGVKATGAEPERMDWL